MLLKLKVPTNLLHFHRTFAAHLAIFPNKTYDILKNTYSNVRSVHFKICFVYINMKDKIRAESVPPAISELTLVKWPLVSYSWYQSMVKVLPPCVH